MTEGQRISRTAGEADGRGAIRLASFQSLAAAAVQRSWCGPPLPGGLPPERSGCDAGLIAPAAGAEEAGDLDALLVGLVALPADRDPDGIDADLTALLEGL